MSNVHKIEPHYTYEDWVQWEGKWELIYGHPIAMSPATIPRHRGVAADVITEFNNALRNSGCKGTCKVYDYIDYKLSEDTILEPDVLIGRGKIEKKFFDFPPTVVVETASPSMALRERHARFEIDQQQCVKYYTLIDADLASIEVYEMHDGIYQVQIMNLNLFEFTLDEGFKMRVDFSTIDFS